MKKKQLLVLLFMSLMSSLAIAGSPDDAKNLQLSFIPLGYQKTCLNTPYDSYDLKYKSVIGGSLGYEFAIKGTTTLLELTYTQSKLDDVTYNKGENALENPSLDVTKFKDLHNFGLMYYGGKIFLRHSRLQIPVYIGIGAEVLKGYPYHHMMFDLGAKARLKFFLSDNVGLFAGASGKYGFGVTSYAKQSGSTKSEERGITHAKVTLDVGLTFLIN